LSNGDTDRFIVDLETLGRERPWTIAASVATLGFLAARVVKASGARHLHAFGYAADYKAAFAQGATDD
jgi:hypothetical protein